MYRQDLICLTASVLLLSFVLEGNGATMRCLTVPHRPVVTIGVGWPALSILADTSGVVNGQIVRVDEHTHGAIDGTEVILEIVGFWTPEYLAHRRETLQQFRHHTILIAVPEKSLREGATPCQQHAGATPCQQHAGASIGENVLVYKTVLKLTPLMEILEKNRTDST
jgi:hypothetical protein